MHDVSNITYIFINKHVFNTKIFREPTPFTLKKIILSLIHHTYYQVIEEYIKLNKLKILLIVRNHLQCE